MTEEECQEKIKTIVQDRMVQYYDLETWWISFSEFVLLLVIEHKKDFPEGYDLLEKLKAYCKDKTNGFHFKNQDRSTLIEVRPSSVDDRL